MSCGEAFLPSQMYLIKLQTAIKYPAFALRKKAQRKGWIFDFLNLSQGG